MKREQLQEIPINFKTASCFILKIYPPLNWKIRKKWMSLYKLKQEENNMLSRSMKASETETVIQISQLKK